MSHQIYINTIKHRLTQLSFILAQESHQNKSEIVEEIAELAEQTGLDEANIKDLKKISQKNITMMSN